MAGYLSTGGVLVGPVLFNNLPRYKMNDIQRQVAALACRWPQWGQRYTVAEMAAVLQKAWEHKKERSNQDGGGPVWHSTLVLAWKMASAHEPDQIFYDMYRHLAPDMGPEQFTAAEEAIRLAKGGKKIHWQSCRLLEESDMLPE